MIFPFKKKNSFRHGIHPPDNKETTNTLKIKRFPFAPVMVIPFAQHIGAPAKAVVHEGQEVERGQVLAEAAGFVSVPIHAPSSGIVRKIGNVPTISGKMSQGIYLEPFPGSVQEVLEGTPIDWKTASPDEIIEAIQKAGIVGLGGAAFPTHVKLKIPKDKEVDTLVINGIECEPFLTTDHRVMLEQAQDIFMGVRYLLKAVGAPRAIIGVEANKQDAAEHLRKHIPSDLPVEVKVVPVKYPQGAEKMLLVSLLNREIPSGKLPLDVKVVSVNVATTAEIGRLLPHGQGIQERVVTITGPGISKKGNYRIPIGTPLRFALEYAGVTENISQVFMGGPMMGNALSNLDISITKGTSGIIVFTDNEVDKGRDKVFPCIKCGACVEACPIFLNPSKLGILALNREYDQMTEEFNLMDCFECGSCTYVCPSQIPLVQQFRVSKSIVRKRTAMQKQN